MTKTNSIMTHNIILEERSKLRISGVNDIDSFTDNKIVLDTVMGELVIKGEDLHISELITETGELSVHGNINNLVYSSFKTNASLIRKMFR